MNLHFSSHYSNWPIMMSLSLGSLLTSVLFLTNFNNLSLMVISQTYFLFSLYMWSISLSREFNYSGWGSQFMVSMFKLGFIIFIFSEIMFFFSFFWAYFHFLLMMSGDSGVFPGEKLILSNFKLLPLMNTLLLLSSGVSLTSAHLHLMNFNFKKFLTNMSLTLSLGLLFLSCQFLEYKELLFLLSDGSYSSIFYLTTSFHGFHVMVGWALLLVVFLKTFPLVFMIFELASWYWHFVDVVWLFLFSFYYWLIG